MNEVTLTDDQVEILASLVAQQIDSGDDDEEMQQLNELLTNITDADD